MGWTTFWIRCGVSGFVLNDFLPYQLAVLSNRVSRDFSARYREKFGISVPEWRVVAHLSQSEKPLSVREIFERVDMDKSKVSRAASRLENLGYLTKATNREDRRLIELALTDKGRTMVEELAPMADAFEKEVMERLGSWAPDFRKAIANLLND